MHSQVSLFQCFGQIFSYSSDFSEHPSNSSPNGPWCRIFYGIRSYGSSHFRWTSTFSGPSGCKRLIFALVQIVWGLRRWGRPGSTYTRRYTLWYKTKDYQGNISDQLGGGHKTKTNRAQRIITHEFLNYQDGIFRRFCCGVHSFGELGAFPNTVLFLNKNKGERFLGNCD